MSAIDRATFASLQDAAGREFVDDLVGTFLDEAPRLLAQLRAAFAARDADGFRRAAHSLKSNGLTFGARKLATQAKALELGGLAAAPAGALEALEAEYRGAAAELEALRHA